MNNKADVTCSICGKTIKSNKETLNGKDNKPVCSERCMKDSWGDVN